MVKHVPKPCPRCESDDVGVVCDGYWNVECGNCELIGPTCATSAEAVRKWNEIPDEPEEERNRWRG